MILLSTLLNLIIQYFRLWNIKIETHTHMERSVHKVIITHISANWYILVYMMRTWDLKKRVCIVACHQTVQTSWWKQLIHSLRDLVGGLTVACPSQLGVTVALLGFSVSLPHLPRKSPALQTRPSPVWLIDFKTAAEHKLFKIIWHPKLFFSINICFLLFPEWFAVSWLPRTMHSRSKLFNYLYPFGVSCENILMINHTEHEYYDYSYMHYQLRNNQSIWI